MKQKGWIICPAYNEGDQIEEFISALDEHLKSTKLLDQYDISALIVDDGSSDSSAKVLRQLADDEKYAIAVEHLRLSRNFGQQAALVAGLDAAASAGVAWACTLDVDGEHPVALIPDLVSLWEQGAPMVHTVREYDSRISALKRAASRTYYWALRKLSSVQIRPGMADFKLWDGDLLRQVQPFLPQAGLLRLFASWLCPNAPTVNFKQPLVAERPSRFTWKKMFSIAFAGLVRYSELPLRFFLLAGVLFFGVGIALALFTLIAFLMGKTVPGWASILIPISLFGALQSLSLGVLAEYFVRLLFRRSLPTYVVEHSSLSHRRRQPS